MRNKKTKIMIIMCVAVLVMATGYAFFATKLDINTTGNITTTWNVYFSNITDGTIVGNASNNSTPSITSTTARMDVNLALPGDSITYELTLTNGGSVNAIIDDIKAEAEGSSAIIYTISGINIGDKLSGGESKVITIKIEYDDVTSQPALTSKTLTVNISCVQDTGQSITVTPPTIEEKTLAAKILKDNTVQSDASIDFSKPSTYLSSYSESHATTTSSVSFSSSSTYYYGTSYTFDSAKGLYTLAGTKTSGKWSTMSSNYSTYPYTCQSTSSTGTCPTMYKMSGYTSTTAGTGYKYTRTANYKSDNGQGLYYTNINTEDSKTTYYFRGNVTNNYVSFAGQTWRIVRINEDGSIRLITQDSVGKSAFNSSTNDNAYVGYMYGTAGSSTYTLTHANTNNNAIKNAVDTWYQNNLTSYSSYLADAGFCNDRSIASTAGSWYTNDTALGYGKNFTIYGAYNRLYKLKKPQFACPQSNDLFTTSSSSKGNKSLTNPIGLITSDEVAYAGGLCNASNNNYYLANEDSFWTMSPQIFDGSFAISWAVDNAGGVGVGFLPAELGVRPVINLKSNVEISGGSGTSTNPYIIKTN